MVEQKMQCRDSALVLEAEMSVEGVKGRRLRLLTSAAVSGAAGAGGDCEARAAMMSCRETPGGRDIDAFDYMQQTHRSREQRRML